MEAHKNTSVFSGLFPSGEAAQPPSPAPQPYKPAAAEEQVAALNKKIELMERNIVGRLEKKLTEQAPPPMPPPPASALAPAVLLKITEMESRLKDFQEKFLLGAAQTRNSEESRISGRREIEELLKVVREQQKYSELDRQMRDQLEKAWGRVEELEKRMMEVYSAAAKKPVEPVVPAVSPAEIAALTLKGVEAGLEERLAPLEAALKNAAAKLEAAPSAALGVERRVAELSAAVDARLAGFSSEIRQLHIEAFAGKERVEEIVADVKKDALSSVREAFNDGSGAFLRHLDAAAMDGRERLDAMVKLLISHLDELAARGRDNALKIDVLETRLKLENEKVFSAVSAMQPGLEKALFAHIDAAAARVASENAWQLERIKEAYRLSAANTAAAAAAAEHLTGIEAELAGVMAGLKALVRAMEPVNLEAVLGVSGAIIRRSFESVRELAAGLEKETTLLARTRGKIETNIKSLAVKPGGEGK